MLHTRNSDLSLEIARESEIAVSYVSNAAIDSGCGALLGSQRAKVPKVTSRNEVRSSVSALISSLLAEKPQPVTIHHEIQSSS